MCGGTIFTTTHYLYLLTKEIIPNHMHLHNSQIINNKIFRFAILLILLSTNIFLFSQPNKRTNHWLISDNISIDFNTGEPVVGHFPLDSLSWGSISTMSDTMGNLLFYSDGFYVYNSEHEIMENSWFDPDYLHGTQSALCMPKPGSDSLYYVFTSNQFSIQYDQPLNVYHTIDITLNNGMGGVSDTDTLPGAWDASEQLNASYFKDKTGYWIIMRKYREHKYAAYKVTEQGVDSNPMLSDAPNRYFPGSTPNMGYMKISYNKKYIVFIYSLTSTYHSDIEICKFNNSTGDIDFLYSFQLRYLIGNNSYKTSNGDFSPDSKYFYVAGHLQQQKTSHIYQFDMQYIEDKDLFIQSFIKVGEPIGFNMQLASDGKIYCFSNRTPGPSDDMASVINKPGKQGVGCDYQENVLFIDNGEVMIPFVNFAPDFLHRFDFDGICESNTFSFDPWFFPEPVSIQWNFGDPASGTNNTSFTPHATHKFTDGGTYEVSVYVIYPNGRIEETSREVEVEYSPEPNLGPDTTVCASTSITLDAECGAHNYLWSTEQFGTSHITVSDTGWYWVKVTSDAGCYEYDSIHISNYDATLADISNLILSPTTCEGSTGAIRGLQIAGTPPLIYQWFDDMGNPIATTIDMYQLPVGNYTLQVTDGNNCVTNLGPYSIIDAGNVLVDGVDFTNEHCNQQDGTIIVTATSGLGDMLYYSIDNGTNYIQNLGVFTNLSSGSYAVRVHDSTMCEDVYINNPIIIQNLLHPEITNVQVTPESTGTSNGEINITATSVSDTIYYSNDAGITTQINNGLFSGLTAGFYTCVVSDSYGCDTTFVVEVPEYFLVNLEAVAGETGVCPGTVAYVPLLVSNFSDVARFTATLLFDPEKLTCQGFINPNAMLEDSLQIMLFPVEGKVELRWNDPSVTLPANSTLVSLVFEASTTGGSLIEWDGSAGANVFNNSSGNQIPVNYRVGEVIIFKEVYFNIETPREVCQGETVILQPSLWSSNGQVTYEWIYPDNTTQNTRQLVINNVQINQSGIYSIEVTDTAGCYLKSLVDLTVFEIPYPDFANIDTIFTDDPFDFNAGAGFSHYLWNTGDTTQYIWVENEGWYTAEVQSTMGCIGEDSSYIVFSAPSELINVFFPNAFTPNGDGNNDEFKVVTNTIDIELFSLSIFNRWGALVYQTNDITQGWDGTFNGTVCQSGSYVFKVTYNTSLHSLTTSETKIGTVMLVR